MNVFDMLNSLKAPVTWKRIAGSGNPPRPPETAVLDEIDVKGDGRSCTLHVPNHGYLCYSNEPVNELGGGFLVRVTAPSGRAWLDYFTENRVDTVPQAR